MKNQAVIIALFFGIISSISASPKRSRIISTHGYENCIELSNNICRVVLELNCGNHILIYETERKNALYIALNQNGIMPTPEELKTTPSSFSIWYFKEIMAELESIGTCGWVAPKGETSYSEIGNLWPYQYPESKEVNVKNSKDKVKALN